MEFLFKKSTLRVIPLLTMVAIISFKSWAMDIATPTWQIFLFYGILLGLNVAVLFQKYKADKVGMKPKLVLFSIILVLTAGIFIYQFNSR